MVSLESQIYLLLLKESYNKVNSLSKVLAGVICDLGPYIQKAVDVRYVYQYQQWCCMTLSQVVPVFSSPHHSHDTNTIQCWSRQISNTLIQIWIGKQNPPIHLILCSPLQQMFASLLMDKLENVEDKSFLTQALHHNLTLFHCCLKG